MMVKIIDRPPEYIAWQYKGGNPYLNRDLPKSFYGKINYIQNGIGGGFITIKDKDIQIQETDWVIKKGLGFVLGMDDFVVVTNDFFENNYKIVED